ncbi:MAG: glucose-phosphate cytidylyltransferase [Pseudomonadota bacterium]
MIAVILAGGLGTRISEETQLRPKPMVEIGGKPILWHIMKIYAHHGVTDFVICLGYKGYVIKEYFANYFIHNSDVTFHLAEDRVDVHQRNAEPWRVTLVDTGEDTQTGGRLKRVANFLPRDEPFCFTYGDGVSDINIASLLRFREQNETLATVTAVLPPGRFGVLTMDGRRVTAFREKPPGDDARVNGGFFVLMPSVIDYIDGDHTVFEREPIERLAREGQLSAYHHDGFWQPMDHLRDKNYLDELWKDGKAPWKVWK